jgi:hypothetical protein
MLVRDLTRAEASLVLKLYRHKRFGAAHMLEDNLLRGFPPDQVGSLRGSLERLKADGIVKPKPTKHGPAAFLDPATTTEIYEQLRKHYSWLPKPPWMK